MEDIDIIGLLQEGGRLEREQKQQEEESKVGVLRGGNSGVLLDTDEGQVTLGGCARQAYLRMIQLEVPTDEDYNSKVLMFQLGLSNEDSWVTFLERSWASQPGHVLLRETDVPTRWETSNGTPVTGRPDIVLARASEGARQGNTDAAEGPVRGATVPVVGLELKQAASMWTVRDILQDKPKTAHLCQAAHYSWQLNVPFELHYTNRVNWHIMANHLPWIGRHFPRYGGRHSEKCDYKLGEPQPATEPTVYKNGKVKPGKPAKPAFQEVFRVLPFVHGFKLRWDEAGVLHYRPVDLSAEHEKETLISKEGIRRYYESAASAPETDKLPPRPAQLEATGEPAGFSQCNYCPLQDICDTHQGGLRSWTQAVKNHIDSLEQTK